MSKRTVLTLDVAMDGVNEGDMKFASSVPATYRLRFLALVGVTTMQDILEFKNPKITVTFEEGQS